MFLFLTIYITKKYNIYYLKIIYFIFLILTSIIPPDRMIQYRYKKKFILAGQVYEFSGII